MSLKQSKCVAHLIDQQKRIDANVVMDHDIIK